VLGAALLAAQAVAQEPPQPAPPGETQAATPEQLIEALEAENERLLNRLRDASVRERTLTLDLEREATARRNAEQALSSAERRADEAERRLRAAEQEARAAREDARRAESDARRWRSEADRWRSEARRR
jgi:hypothetical protein